MKEIKPWEEYLKQANRDIQIYEEHHELREFVASLLCDNDRLNNIINELEKMLESPYNVDCISQNKAFLNKLQELKEGK